MTNNEAAKWIQLYIDLAKIDPSAGEEAYLNEDDRKTLEAMEMARDALTCNRLATNLQPCKQDDLISRQAALDCFHDWVDRYGDVHTPDEMPEYRAIEALPSVESDVPDTNVGDTISRQAAIALAKDICVPIKDGTVYKHRCIDQEAIRSLPSVHPEQTNS